MIPRVAPECDRKGAEEGTEGRVQGPVEASPERTGLPPAGSWRRELALGFRQPRELLEELGLEGFSGGPRPGDAREGGRDGEERPGLRVLVDSPFPLRVPRGFVARMRPGDPHDPLLAQVLPRWAEEEVVPGFTRDPLGEQGRPGQGPGAGADAGSDGCGPSPRPGLLQKYRGRALLVVTGACAVHCRYCFRRHFPYGDHLAGRDAVPGEEPWAAALDHLGRDASLTEIILSGGDPLVLTDDRLAALAGRLAAIPHLRRLRVHSRMPVVLPERVDGDLLAWLAGTRLAPVLVLHANHPREIDGAVLTALGHLRRAGVTLLNQAVLLAGVNDDAGTLAELSERLFEGGVLPYYLHLLDPVAGAAHFDVPEQRGRELVAELTARLPGYLVPRLVREVEGAPAKVPVDLRFG